MGAHKKQRIFSILAILTMAVLLTCVFTACDKTGAQGKTFTITFDSMGGSNVSSITIKDGETLVMPADPTKPGYVFAGWYSDRNYSSVFSESSTITQNITVYAKWQEVFNNFENIVFENKTYSYDGKPHSLSISGYPEGTSVSFDIDNAQTMVGVYVITATLTKTGYATKSYTATLTIDKGIIDTSKFKFEDKQFQQDGTPKSLELVGELPYGVTVEYINNDQTLDGVYTVTAHFVYDKNLYYEVQDMTATMTIVTPLTQYRINYELYNGVNSGKNPTTYLSPNEKEIKLYPATRSAWIFDGWYRNEQFEGSPITELPQNTSGDIYLYAKWVKPYVIASDDAFTITGKTITATVGHDVSMYSFIESFNACSDCTWSLYSDYLGTNELVLKNMQLNYGMNTAYIVVWSEDRSAFTQYTLNVYRLSMRQYSYSILGSIIDSGEIEEQSALSTPENPDVRHYIFEGWYIGEQKIEFPYVVNVDSNIVAKMTPIEYSLTYVLNGGTNDESNPTTYNVENIGTLMSTLKDASKDYYDFNGWSLSLADIEKISSMELGALTLNADFTPTVYNLVFHKEGGNYSSEYKEWKSLYVDFDMSKWESCYEDWLNEKGLSVVLDKMKESDLGFENIELAWQLCESGKNIDDVEWEPLSEEEARNAWAARVLSVVYGEFNDTTPCDVSLFAFYFEFFGLCASDELYESTYTVESADILFESIHKNGYRFVGWYDNAEFDGEPITIIPAGSHGNVDLYAKWEQVTYNFVYELNGGTNNAQNALTFTVDTFIDAISDLQSASKDYYNFKSWTCGPDTDAYNAWMADGSASLCTYADVYTLTAEYTPIDYSITYNLGGGRFDETPVSEYNIETENLTLPIPSRTGYTFEGWFDNAELTGEAIAFIALGSHDDKVFYAKWQTIDYAITYNLNDDNSVSAAINSSENPSTYTIEDSITFAAPTRVGYKFVGWDRSKISVGNYGEITVTANWEVINYQISYDLNCEGSASLAVNSAENPATYTIEDAITFAAPSRNGYNFVAWSVPAIEQGTTGDVTTVASWSIIHYAITYDFSIATDSNSQTVENGANPSTYTVEDEIAFAAPSRDGYTFASWDIPTIEKGTYGAKTIVASWNIVTYSVTYNLNGGTNHSENPSSFNVEQLPITLKDADSEEDVFNSWRSINSIDGEKITQIITTGDKTVYALFGGTEGVQYTLSSDGTYYFVSGYSGTATDVLIGKRYNNTPVTSIASRAFYNNSNILFVKIPNTVTSIGNSAFYGCTRLTSVTIPDSVTSIGNYAFEGCYKLVEVYNKSSLTITAGSSDNGYVAYYAKNIYTTEGGSKLSIDENGYVIYTDGTEKILVAYTGSETELTLPSDIIQIYKYAFYVCRGLTSIVIPNSVTSIGSYVFRGCTGLTSVTIGSGVTSIGNSAFYNCTGLTSVNWNAIACTSAGSSNYPIFEGCTNLATVNIGENVMSIPSYAFYGCSGLMSISISDSVTSIGSYAFRGCTGLTSVTIGSGVTSIGNSAFYNCTGLTSVNWNAIACTSAGSYNHPIFEGCTNLAVVNIGENVTSIPSYAFRGCTGLTSVTIGSGVTSIGEDAFYNCTGLTTVNWNAIACTSAGSSNSTIFSGCANLATVNIGENVMSIPSYAFRGCSGLTSVTIGSGVTSIGNSAFYNCTGLTSVVIPDSVMSIGQYTFRDCTGLTSVTIGNSVTSIGFEAFRGCTGLTSVTIPDSVTSINSYVFSGCTGLTIVNWNATACTNTGSYGDSIFSGCANLATVNIGENVTSIPSYAFYNCTRLTTVNWNAIACTSAGSYNHPIFEGCTNLAVVNIGENVTSIPSNAFSGCSGLTSITIPDSVMSIGSSAFKGCTGLTSITIPDSVTSIGSYAFSGCTGLTSITIPDSVTSIDYEAFSGCTGLTSVTIGSGVTSIGSSAFVNCYKLIEVYNKSSLTITAGSSGNGNVAYYAKNVYTTEGGSKLTTDENGYVVYVDGDVKILVAYTGTETELTSPSDITQINHHAFYGCTGLTSVTIGSGVTSIGYCAFEGCTGLTSITIPDSVTSISWYAFEGCTGLTSVTIGSGVTSIGDEAFKGCTGLTSIYYTGDVEGWCGISGLGNVMCYGSSPKTLYIDGNEVEGEFIIPDSVTSIPSYAFYGCTGLTSIVIPDSVTSIGERAFSGCSGLTSITIPDSVMSIGSSAFKGCTGLTSITIPDSVTSIGWYAFKGCTGLTSITIPDSVTSIGWYAFEGCTGLASITIPDSVTSIDSCAFYGCTGLTSIVVASGNTKYHSAGNCLIETESKTIVLGSKNSVMPTDGSVTSIGEHAFYGCTGLTSVTIPDSVTSIGYCAFYGCTGLTSVFYAGTAEQWAAISIDSNNGCLTGATRIYNYDGVERTYSFVTNCDESVDPVTAIYLSTLPTVTKEGHYFCGWYDNAEFAGNAIAAPYYSKDKTTLYAKWLTEEEWSLLPDGTSFEKAFIAESGKTYDVNVTTGGQIVYFAFTPTTSGSFTIQSTGSGDTYGTLYSASHSSLTTNDDDGDGNNFKITYTMTAGTTYYVAVKFYNSSTTGTFKVQFS